MENEIANIEKQLEKDKQGKNGILKHQVSFTAVFLPNRFENYHHRVSKNNLFRHDGLQLGFFQAAGVFFLIA